jgi:predicted RNA-binding Zn ribbon-like protein
MASNPAPGDLERVRRFVNTFDGEGPVEELDSPAALRTWLADHDLLEPGARVTTRDLEHAHAVREALRAVLVSHHGEPLAPAVPAYLDDAARRAGVGLRFGPDGQVRVAPTAAGVDGALGQLLAIVHEAERDGKWARLKVCPADDCQVAFYDNSRNHSAVWCDMAVCGNRAKVREYRARSVSPKGGTNARARAR